MAFSIVFNILSVLVYGPLFSVPQFFFFCRKEVYITKYVKVTFYVIINLYLIQIEFVAKLIILSNQQVNAARFSKVTKVTCVPKQNKGLFP